MNVEESFYLRPRLVLSRCLELAACRYNGVSVRAPVVRILQPWVELVPICPEVEIGLGVPRDPIRLVRSDNGIRLVQPSTGRDLSRRMESFSSRFLASLGEVDGFLLKARSPSCGPGDAKVFADPLASEPAGAGSGMFADAVIRSHPHLAVEQEERLLDRRVLDDFLTRLFCSARLRAAVRGGKEALEAFHADHRWILAARDPEAPARLGRLLSGSERAGDGGAGGGYLSAVLEVLSRPLGRSSLRTEDLPTSGEAGRLLLDPYPPELRVRISEADVIDPLAL